MHVISKLFPGRQGDQNLFACVQLFSVYRSAVCHHEPPTCGCWGEKYIAAVLCCPEALQFEPPRSRLGWRHLPRTLICHRYLKLFISAGMPCSRKMRPKDTNILVISTVSVKAQHCKPPYVCFFFLKMETGHF